MDINVLKKEDEVTQKNYIMLQRIREKIKNNRDGIEEKRHETKEFFQPVIEAQEEVRNTIDEKQNELIKQLEYSQKSIVSGLEDVILYNNLPNEIETKKEPLPLHYQPKMTETKKMTETIKSDFNKSFNDLDLNMLDTMGLISPARLSTTEYSKDKVYEMLNKSNKFRKNFGSLKGKLTAIERKFKKLLSNTKAPKK